jgi:hypothetical protein
LTSRGAEYQKVYAALERELYPDHCPGMADATLIRATRAVFRALGMKDRARA